MNPLYPLGTKDVAPRNQKFFKDQPQKEGGRGGREGRREEGRKERRKEPISALQTRNRDTDVENKCMDTKGGKRGGWVVVG